MRYVYLQSGSDQLFGTYETASEPGAAVLICAPWGWEETASYRSRRTLALRLAAAGHPTLRFDLPGVGDSSGYPGDPDRLAAWITAVADAADWLRRQSGRSRLAVLGMGFGGLLAAAAAEGGAEIDELILWAMPSRGKRFLRETESFARMQAWGAGRGEESPLPEGWIEAGGFVISAETAEALRNMPPPLTAAPERLRRVLVLDRDGLAPDQALAERLEGAGVETTADTGPGWGKMVFHPEHATLPVETIERVERWLAAGGEESRQTLPSVQSPAIDEEMVLADPAITERPITISQSFGEAFAIVAEPLGGSTSDVCALFLNAGAVRHIGPNRNWVENGRRWAGRGIPTVRVDLEGIGEADGDRSQHPGVAGFYDETYAPQLTKVIDELERLGYGSRFVCVGLCSGAYWALHIADRDPRVIGGVLLNAGAIFWDPDLRSKRDARLLWKSIGNRDSWRRLLSGEVDLRAKVEFLAGLLRSFPSRAAHRVREIVRREAPLRDVPSLFDRLRDEDKRIAMAFCANEPVLAELTERGIDLRVGEWPNLELESLAGEDHALGPVGAQRSAEEIIDRELSAALEAEDVKAQVAGS